MMKMGVSLQPFAQAFDEESFTRRQFKSWLVGDQESVSGTQIDLFASKRIIPREKLTQKLRGEAYAISCVREATRWSFLDRVCERIEKEGDGFFSDPSDPDSIEWYQRLKAIRRDVHKAHAFVRFKKITMGENEVFAAWHRPQHDTLDLFVRLFVRRFPRMDWTVVTSDEAAHFRNGRLSFGEGHKGQNPEVNDNWEDFWRTYYASIYNPARLMVNAMTKEMPKWHWQTLPESRLIPQLIRESRPRLARMARKAQMSAESFLPRESTSVDDLAKALPACEGCNLFAHCRAVPGIGNQKPSLVLVGEQPGDEEEKLGVPFIGPAGQVLRKAVLESGAKWNELYITNAVKHFKFEYEGPRRLHKRPERDEVAACRPWLRRELELLEPKTVLCLGSTAALSVTGRLWPVERYRGTWLPSSGAFRVFLTYHPAAILRTSPEKAEQYYSDLVEDLKIAHAN